MGASSSNFERNPSTRGTLSKTTREVDQLYTEIQNSSATDEEYKKFHDELIKFASRVQKIRNNKLKTKYYQSECPAVLSKINDCWKILDEKRNVSSRESNLDMGAVESNSFISQDITRQVEQNNLVPRYTDTSYRIHSLKQISQRLDELDDEIRKCVSSNDMKNLIVAEKKIRILYQDLDQLETPQMHERTEKEHLVDRLFKYNKKIERTKHKSGIYSDYDNKDGPAFSKPSTLASDMQQNTLQVIQNMERTLNDLEVAALTFDDVQVSPNYQKMERNLIDSYAIAENLPTETDEERRKINNVKSLIKKILNNLQSKANENEAIISRERKNIENIEKQLLEYKTQSQYLSGAKDSQNYIQLDQKIRATWDQLNNVDIKFDVNIQYKEKIISQIQQVLKDMSGMGEEQRLQQNIQNFQDLWNKMKIYPTLKTNEQHRRVLQDIYTELHDILRVPSLNLRKSTEMMDKLIGELAINEKSVNLRASNRHSTETDTITRIHTIEKDLGNVRESVSQFKGTTDSEDYDSIEDTLINHKKEIEACPDSSRIIVDAKRRTLNAIDEANGKLRIQAELNDIRKENMIRNSQRGSNQKINRPSAQEMLEHIMQVDSNTHDIEKQIDKFEGTTKDKEYENLMGQLNDNNTYLQNLDINHQDSLRISMQDVQKHINDLHMKLTTKASENETKKDNETTKIKEILRVVKQLEKKVDCFHGTYRNIQYKQIETELLTNMDKLEAIQTDNAKIANAKQKTISSIKRYLRILDEKSIKPQLVPISLTFAEIYERIIDVKNRMEVFKGTKSDDEYFHILKDLHSCKDDLYSLNNDEANSIKKQKYIPYLDSLFDYFNKKTLDEPVVIYSNQFRSAENLQSPQSMQSSFRSAENLQSVQSRVAMDSDFKSTENLPPIQSENSYLPENLQSAQSLPIYASLDTSSVNKTVDDDQEALDILQSYEKEHDDVILPRIKEFQGSKEDVEYAELHEDILDLMMKIDKIKSVRKPRIKKRKTDVLDKLKMSAEQLDSMGTSEEPTGNGMQELEDIHKAAEVLSEQVDQFNGGREDADYDILDGALITIFLKLDRIVPANNTCKEKKKFVMNIIQTAMKLLQTKISNHSRLSDSRETLV